MGKRAIRRRAEKRQAREDAIRMGVKPPLDPFHDLKQAKIKADARAQAQQITKQSRKKKKALNKKLAELRANIVPIDWASKELTPFGKELYEENPITAARSSEEVEAYRSKHGITVDGEAPKPTLTFEELKHLPDFFTKATSRLKYKEPKPIQAHSWPIIMSGLNMACITKADPGKTLAYILPALVHIKKQPPLQKGDGPVVVVLSPIRESVVPIEMAASQASALASVKTAAVITFQKKETLLRILKQESPGIVVALPRRLKAVVKAGLTNLQRCTLVVLDDLDQMLQMGLEEEIREVLNQIRPDRQIIVWTSLWTEKVSQMAKDFMTEFVTVKIGALQLSKNYAIQQIVEVCAEIEKGAKLKELLAKIYNDEKFSGMTVIFVDTRARAHDVAQFVRTCSLTCGVAHSFVPVQKGCKMLKVFREEGTQVLVATDNGIRGLDLNSIEYVINFDFPMGTVEYLQRIEQTGRDRDGFAYTFFTTKDVEYARSLIDVLRAANQNIPPMLVQLSKGEGFDIDPMNSERKKRGKCGIEDFIKGGRKFSEDEGEPDDADLTEGLYAGGGAGFGDGNTSETGGISTKTNTGGGVEKPVNNWRADNWLSQGKFDTSSGFKTKAGGFAVCTVKGGFGSRSRSSFKAGGKSRFNAREEAKPYEKVSGGRSDVVGLHAGMGKGFADSIGFQTNSLEGIRLRGGGDTGFGDGSSSSFGNRQGSGVERDANSGRGGGFNSRSDHGFNTNSGGGGFSDRGSGFGQQRESNYMGAPPCGFQDRNDRGPSMWSSVPSSSNYNVSVPEFDGSPGGRSFSSGRGNDYGYGEKDNTTFNIRTEDGFNRSGDGGFSGNRDSGFASRDGRFGGKGDGGIERRDDRGFGARDDPGFGNRDDDGFGSKRDGRFGNRDDDGFGARGDSGMGARHEGGFGGRGDGGFRGKDDDGFGLSGDSGLGSRGETGFGYRGDGGFANKGNDGGFSNRNDVGYGRRNDALFMRRGDKSFGNNRYGGPSDRDQNNSNANSRYNQHRPNNRGMDSGYGGNSGGGFGFN